MLDRIAVRAPFPPAVTNAYTPTHELGPSPGMSNRLCRAMACSTPRSRGRSGCASVVITHRGAARNTDAEHLGAERRASD